MRPGDINRKVVSEVTTVQQQRELRNWLQELKEQQDKTPATPQVLIEGGGIPEDKGRTMPWNK